MSERCKEHVWTNGGFHGHQCSRKAVKDGYCKIHHPDSVKARREKSAQRYKEQYAKSPIGLLKKAREKIESLTQQLESARKDAENLEYWRSRCQAAEEYIAESPCDPDIYESQLKAYQAWMKIVETSK